MGNLSVGGTGKTPMIEYLVRLLQPTTRIATLSRGYKRQTKGFLIADNTATASTLGDEPFQFYRKFRELIVSVDENRVHGINRLLKLNESPDVILLDDAFQHRSVRAGLNIMLSSYSNLYINDIVLPTGNLREPRSGAKRADIIVITKCPQNINIKEKKRIAHKVALQSHQHLFFATIAYNHSILGNNIEIPLTQLKNQTFTLVTGIANPEPLLQFLRSEGLIFEHLRFKDHHEFTPTEITELQKKSMLVTTEKDMVRLQPHFLGQTSLFYLPITMQLDKPDEFDSLILDFIR